MWHDRPIQQETASTFQNNTSSDRIFSGSPILYFAAVAAVIVAAAIWAMGDQKVSAAARYQSAPRCTSGGQSDCVSYVTATSAGDYLTTHCGPRHCTYIWHVIVQYQDGRTEDLTLATDPIPADEFAQGQPLQLELYNGVVFRLQGPNGTVLQTVADPVGQDRNYHNIALIIGGSGVILALLGWYWSLRPDPGVST